MWKHVYLRKAKLLLLRLLGGANSKLLVSSINTYLQVNSSLVFTSHDAIARKSQCDDKYFWHSQKISLATRGLG